MAEETTKTVQKDKTPKSETVQTGNKTAANAKKAKSIYEKAKMLTEKASQK
jgi:hypothetical protein